MLSITKLLLKKTGAPAQYPICIKCFFLYSNLLLAASGYSQTYYYHDEPQDELALGIKAVTRKIVYGKNDSYRTDPTSIGIQPVIRYDYPFKLYTRTYKPHYIDIVAQAGFLFCKAAVFDTTIIDPVNNTVTHEHSFNPTYLPLSFGVYNRSALSVGAEVFFWKGFGTRDIWGVKFISIGYNARHFRLSAAGERYLQIINSKNGGTLLSIDFLWKLINED